MYEMNMQLHRIHQATLSKNFNFKAFRSSNFDRKKHTFAAAPSDVYVLDFDGVIVDSEKEVSMLYLLEIKPTPIPISIAPHSYPPPLTHTRSPRLQSKQPLLYGQTYFNH
jgi:hypothetical protein